MPQSPYPDHERCWVRRAQAGDADAFKELFLAYHGRLCRFAATYVGGADAAREVVQMTFVRIWERRQEWTIRHSLAAYLYQAVRNQALNHVRHEEAARRLRDRLGGVQSAVTAETPQQCLQRKEVAETVQAAINDLPPRRRRVYVLHRQHGLSYAEIAEVMGIATKTVENQMGRALKSLRAQLASYYAEVQK